MAESFRKNGPAPYVKRTPTTLGEVQETDPVDFIKRDPTRPERFKKIDLSALLAEMPPFVARNHPRFKEWTTYSGRTMANMDCLKQTLAIKKIILGNTTCYERESLVKWLESRAKIVE
ncbi:MAG: hypothetical protein LLG97_03830 [Deltaproteobacteria bacterium]|nr:hypothetical protein [Deltaproteobacteria bacterium]